MHRDIINNNNKDPILVKDRVFKSIPGFKEWIEQTSLFSNISRHAGSGLEIRLIPNDMSLNLTGVNKIETANDLPIELILEFYKNSPFYDETKFSNDLKLIE